MAIFYLIRFSLASIFSYTFLNAVGVFKIPLDFPWAVMIIPIIFGWWFWEKVSKKNLAFSKLSGSLIVLLIYAEQLGNTFGFFEKINWYDNLTHFIGGATINLLSYLILDYLNKKYNWKLALKFLIIFSLSITLTLGVFWEFYEYFVDTFLNTNLIANNKFDTAEDLLFSFLGATFLIFILVLFSKSKRILKINH